MIPGAPLALQGDPYIRGRAQAASCPDSIAAVRTQLTARLDAAAPLLAQRHVARFLAAQWDFARREDPEGMAEMDGVADGYGLAPRDLFAFLHAGQLTGLPDDGCTSWAHVDPQHGAILVKNRDLRGNALPLQRVFLQQDPLWGGRSVLCVGSLGAPGAYSSGINSDGFALVDTQVVTRDQGIGLLRYFLMTRLLATCPNVDAAIATLHETTHAGGGTLVLADASGTIAAVEIGHSGIAVQRRSSFWVARTNHFLASGVAPSFAKSLLTPAGGPDLSPARLARLTAWLEDRSAAPTAQDAARFMASHDGDAGPGPCRHGQETSSSTVSCAVFTCRPGGLDFAHGNPCEAAWHRYAPPQHYGAGTDGVRDRAGR